MSLNDSQSPPRKKEDGSIGERPSGKFARRSYVDNFEDSRTGSILSGIKFDAVEIQYPNNTTEVYVYYSGGVGGDVVATVTTVYTSASKNLIQSIVRT